MSWLKFLHFLIKEDNMYTIIMQEKNIVYHAHLKENER